MKYIKISILIFFLLFSLFLDLSSIPQNFTTYYFYVIKPLYWLFVFIVLIIFYKNEILINKKYVFEIRSILFIFVMLYLLVYFWIGIFNGFGYNPYNTNFKGIIVNLWTIIPFILAREYIRYYIISNCKQKYVLIETLMISLMFVLIESNLFKLNIYFSNSLSTLKYFMEIFVPSLILQLFLTYLTYFSGYLYSFLYSLYPYLIMYCLPILPNIETPTLAIINSIFPFVTYLFINYKINKLDKTIDRKQYKITSPVSVIILFIFTITMLCFGLGVFPYEPLVIASDSMYPQIKKGDIVIVKEYNYNKLNKGDIIRYKIDDYYVVHRINEIFYDNGNLKLITKGDNNRDIDLFAVNEEQFEGLIKYKISYLGWPTVLLNELFNNDSDKVIIEKGD